MNTRHLIDLRHFEAPPRNKDSEPKFIPPDHDDVEKVNKFKRDLWMKREATKYAKRDDHE